jgi:hypothetical protein
MDGIGSRGLMSAKSQNGVPSTGNSVLRWTGGIVTAEALRGSLNGEREIVVAPRTVITPLAADHLKTNGVRVVRNEESARPKTPGEAKTVVGWAYAQERLDPMIGSVVQSLKREGLNLSELSPGTSSSSAGDMACSFTRNIGQRVVRGECRGAVVFCLDPGLVCCVANKVKGIRAVPIQSAAEACRGIKGLAPNFVALEIGKSTFYEMRQILRGICGTAVACPEIMAKVFKELEGLCECQQTHGPTSVALEAKCHCGGGHAHR